MDKLPYRFEFKYPISPNEIECLESELKKFGMRPDSSTEASGGSYWVASLYFDSYDFIDYQEKSGGLLERKKIRARIYEPFLDKSESVWLELKKRHDAKIFKTRLKLNREEWKDLMERGTIALAETRRDGEAERARKEILRAVTVFSAKPKIVVRYRRKSLISTSNAIRITFDSGLEACRKGDLDYNGFMTAVNRGGAILEIKSVSALPQWLGDMIIRHDLKRDAFSKYAYAIEAVYQYNPLPR